MCDKLLFDLFEGSPRKHTTTALEEVAPVSAVHLQAHDGADERCPLEVT